MPETLATPDAHAFLSGQGIPVHLGRIESELTNLWGPAAESVGGPSGDENPAVTRLVLANLIVEAGPAAAGRVLGALDPIIARFPSRSIVLGRTGEAGHELTAEVAALCHLPAPGLPQVCSERIVLRAGAEATGLLAGAVRPLLEADLPVVLWWTSDPRTDPDLFRSLARDATRIILDLPDPGAPAHALRLGLDPAINRYSRDSAWFGIARWRELIAQFFDGQAGRTALRAVRSVAIEVESPPGDVPPRLAAWLVAWIAGQLGWESVGTPSHAPGRTEATFRAGGRDVVATISEVADTAATGVRLVSAAIEADDEDGPCAYRLSRPGGCPDHLRVEVCSGRTCDIPRVVIAPELDLARRISAGLESSRVDAPFGRALPHLLWLLELATPVRPPGD